MREFSMRKEWKDNDEGLSKSTRKKIQRREEEALSRTARKIQEISQLLDIEEPIRKSLAEFQFDNKVLEIFDFEHEFLKLLKGELQQEEYVAHHSLDDSKLDRALQAIIRAKNIEKQQLQEEKQEIEALYRALSQAYQEHRKAETDQHHKQMLAVLNVALKKVEHYKTTFTDTYKQAEKVAEADTNFLANLQKKREEQRKKSAEETQKHLARVRNS